MASCIVFFSVLMHTRVCVSFIFIFFEIREYTLALVGLSQQTSPMTTRLKFHSGQGRRQGMREGEKGVVRLPSGVAYRTQCDGEFCVRMEGLASRVHRVILRRG